MSGCPIDNKHTVKEVTFSNKKGDFFIFCNICKDDVIHLAKKQLKSNNDLFIGCFNDWNFETKSKFVTRYPSFCNHEDFKKWTNEDQKEWYKFNKFELKSESNNEKDGFLLDQEF